MTKPIQHLIATIGILLCLPSLAFSETYYDCNGPDKTMTYRAEPCHKGEWEIQRHEVDLSIYDNKNKEWVGMASSGPLELHPEPNGNYLVDGSINGHAVKFVVDTGASFLSLTAEVAAAFGVTDCKAGSKTATANGVVDTCMGTAKQITFGNLQLNDVEISIVPNLAGNPLLGMNVLSKFRVDTSNHVMRISKQ